MHQFSILVPVEAPDENGLLPGPAPIQSTVLLSTLMWGRRYIKRVPTKINDVLLGATRISCLFVLSRRLTRYRLHVRRKVREDAVHAELPEKN
jgi:hypothetical protein